MSVKKDGSMKRTISLLSAGIGIIAVGAALGIHMRIRRNRQATFTIIGNADGPTSVFLAGKFR